ncbi:MAG TPA: hypothetical protein VEL49_01470 [Ktedonobacteraceae bacterium]|nr:hypothetical protein [Ktedonobacteraceae bacterium]
MPIATAADVMVPVVGKLIIRRVDGKHEPDVITSIDFMKVKMCKVCKQWAEIEKILRKRLGFRYMREVPEQDTPTINYR